MGTVYRVSKAVDGQFVDKVHDLLSGRATPESKETLTVSVQFENGWEADIKVVQDADSPYLDPVLFDQYGFEVTCLQDESESLEGAYRFDVDDDVFIVEIQRT